MFNGFAEVVSRRRALMIAPLAVGGFVAVLSRVGRSPDSGDANADVTIVEFDGAGSKRGSVVRKKVVHSDGDWRRQLSTGQY